jgi:galactosamine-6-phosphate isomerase
MKVFVDDTYQASSRHAADDLIAKVSSIKNPVICAASGDSPAGLYKQLVEKVQRKQLDISDWVFLGLDEWIGMNGSNEGSCRYHLDQQLFGPLQIPKERICFFDGRSQDLEGECRRIEKFIQEHNGIDATILGLGTNGHVGMNEPGTSAQIRSHIAELHESTKLAGQKYFKNQQILTQGLTLGIANLMESKHVMLLISGPHKATITQRIFEEEVSEQLPATLLRKHPSFSVYLEPQSAQMMWLHSQKP